jgi:hypothetical protein
MKFNYGDIVIVKTEAPLEYRPGESGAVCGMWEINDQTSKEFALPVNTQMYTVEYGDRTDCQIPEEYLILEETYDSFKEKWNIKNS